jgi:hypothetical protein
MIFWEACNADYRSYGYIYVRTDVLERRHLVMA